MRMLAELSGLSPAYFGMVMATGIVSLAAHLLAMPAIAQALFQLNIVVYAVLWFLTVLRMARYPRRFFGDMVDHLRGPGFFTTVAGTSVLGSQFVLLAADYRAGTVLWVVAILLWILLTYTIFAGFTIKEHKPTLDQGISGAWLLAVVATQSIAVLSALLATHIGQPGKLEMNFLALSMWLWGGMLYIWMMSLIFYRYTFFPFSPAICHHRTGSTWAQWRSRLWRGRCSSSMRPTRPFCFRCCPLSKALRSSTGRPALGGYPCWWFSPCGATCTGASR